MEDLEKEKEYYSKEKNWDFSQIKYTTIYNPENEFDFYTMISRFINIEVSFEMNEILPYLFNYAYLQICGALEKKVQVSQYYLMSINYDYAYKHKVSSIYAPNDLVDFFKKVDKYFNLGMNIDKGNFFQNFIYKYLINDKLIYDLHIDDMKQCLHIGNQNKNSAIVSALWKQYCDFENNWKNLEDCVSEAKIYHSEIDNPEKFLNELYKKIWEHRHNIAHNLNSLYYEVFEDSIYLNNYFFKIILLFNIDTILIDVMKNKIDKQIT